MYVLPRQEVLRTVWSSGQGLIRDCSNEVGSLTSFFLKLETSWEPSKFKAELLVRFLFRSCYDSLGVAILQPSHHSFRT